MLLGSGELGKEVAIELQRLGVETIAVDRYSDAPAMHVAHRAHVIDMLDPAAVRALVETEKPDLVIPQRLRQSRQTSYSLLSEMGSMSYRALRPPI